jgi:hypothetical protein
MAAFGMRMKKPPQKEVFRRREPVAKHTQRGGAG